MFDRIKNDPMIIEKIGLLIGGVVGLLLGGVVTALAERSLENMPIIIENQFEEIVDEQQE